MEFCLSRPLELSVRPHLCAILGIDSKELSPITAHKPSLYRLPIDLQIVLVAAAGLIWATWMVWGLTIVEKCPQTAVNRELDALISPPLNFRPDIDLASF